jgi:hypothetical protein
MDNGGYDFMSRVTLAKQQQWKVIGLMGLYAPTNTTAIKQVE